MSDIAGLVSNHLDIWTAATDRKSGAGRSGSRRMSLYGIERLRALILDLAVRGKLVPQDASDGDAATLLRAIANERRTYASSRGLKVPKVSERSHRDPFDLPANWAWTTVGMTGVIFTGNSINEATRAQLASTKTGRPFVATKDVGYGGDPIAYDTGLHVADNDPSFVWARAGTVFICAEGGSAGRKMALSDREICFGNKLIANETWSGVDPNFAILVYRADFFYAAFASEMTGIIGGISRGKFLALPFPLPPLAEQRRIVTKVKELMALCDALEGSSAAALAAHQTLVETLLATLVNSDDALDLPANWSRLQTHFDTLFTSEASIDALEKTILELAVSGRLVSNSDDVKPGTLDDVGDWVGGNGFPKQYQGNQEGELAFLKVSDMNLPGNERQITVSNNWVSTDALRAMRARAHPVGTIIFPKIGGAIATNKRRILAVPAAIDNNCAGQIPRQGIDVDWLFMVLSSIDMAAYQAGTSVPALNMKRLGKHPVAIPSNEAQREIVSKVNALMDLCDGLKASIADTGQIQMRLADAIIERAAG